MQFQDRVEACLDHFAHEDAVVLAEAYHNRVQSERSLLVLAQSLARSGKWEVAYHLLKNYGFDQSARCRYLFARCAFNLDRLQEAEDSLRDAQCAHKVTLHPCFQPGSPSKPFAESLLAQILW